jgi:hypothetical protein
VELSAKAAQSLQICDAPSFAHDYDRLVTWLSRAPTLAELMRETGLTRDETCGMVLLLAEERGWV